MVGVLYILQILISYQIYNLQGFFTFPRLPFNYWLCTLLHRLVFCLLGSSHPNGPEVVFHYGIWLQFSRSAVSDSLRPHELQHARPPCTSPTPRVHPNSCPSSQWCHPAISSSDVLFSSCPQSVPASESFPMSQLFTWGGQSIGIAKYLMILSIFSCAYWLFVYHLWQSLSF